MKHLFVPYKLAEKLKEKGFDEPCLGRYRDKKFQLYSVIKEHCYNSDPISHKDISAPLYQQVIDFFREKHNINIEVQYRNTDHVYLVTLYPMQPRTTLDVVGKFKNYYDALNKAIEEALKLI